MLFASQETSRHIKRNKVPGNDKFREGDKAEVSQEVCPDRILLPGNDWKMTFELNLVMKEPSVKSLGGEGVRAKQRQQAMKKLCEEKKPPGPSRW